MVRIGMVGVGNRGVEVPAVCDINESNLARAQGTVEKSGRSRTAVLPPFHGPDQYRCSYPDVTTNTNTA